MSFDPTFRLKGAYYIPMVGVSFFGSIFRLRREFNNDVLPTLQFPMRITVIMSVGTSIDLGVIAHVNVINSKNI